MISSKDRKALIAFNEVVGHAPRNFSTEAIDHLASEIHDLNLVLQKEETGLSLRSSWIERDLSFVIVFEESDGLGNFKPLLRLQVTPISSVKAQIVASFPSSPSRKQKIYHHMDNASCAGRFIDDVRSYLKMVTPMKLQDDMILVLNGVDRDSEEFEDLRVLVKEVIPGKYSGAKEPLEAYVLAHE